MVLRTPPGTVFVPEGVLRMQRTRRPRRIHRVMNGLLYVIDQDVIDTWPIENRDDAGFEAHDLAMARAECPLDITVE